MIVLNFEISRREKNVLKIFSYTNLIKIAPLIWAGSLPSTGTEPTCIINNTHV